MEPVEVVSLCDVDRKMLADAARYGRSAAEIRRRSRARYSDYREMLKEKRSGHRADRAAGPLARADHDRGGEVRRGCLRAEAHQRGRDGRRRRCWRPRASTSAWCRWACSAAVRRTWWRPKSDSSTTGKLGKIALGGNLLLLPHARDRESAGHRAARESRLRDVDRARAHAPLQHADSSAQAGARSWNMATASSATCASTCST